MKKNLFILILIITFVSGCSLNGDMKEYRDNGDDKSNIDNYIGMKYESKNEIKCEEMKSSKFLSNSLFVTEDSKIYQYGFDKLFSNEQNCLRIDDKLDYGWSGPVTLSKIVGLRGSEAIDTKYQQILFYGESNKLFVGGTYDYVVKNLKEWYFTSPYIIERKDGKLYAVVESNSPFVEKEIKGDIPANETIISINGGVVKTDKGYYVIKEKISNIEQCEKYEDIKCESEYYIESSKVLNNLKDKIYIAYSDSYRENNNTIQIYAKNNYIYSIQID